MQRTYRTDGSNLRFVVPFPYLDRLHVFVTVQGNPWPYTWHSPTEIDLRGPLVAGLDVVVARLTPDLDSFAAIDDASNLTAAELNRLRLQLLFLIQERSGNLGNVAGAFNAVGNDLTAITDALTTVNEALAQLEANSILLAEFRDTLNVTKNTADTVADDLLAEIQSRLDEGTVFRNRLANLDVTVNGFGGAVTQESIARNDNDVALGGRIDTITARTTQAEADIQELRLASSDPELTSAVVIERLSAMRAGEVLNSDPWIATLANWTGQWTSEALPHPALDAGFALHAVPLGEASRNTIRYTGTAARWATNGPTIPVAAGRTYRISLAVRRNASFRAGGLDLALQAFDASGTLLGAYTAASTTAVTAATMTLTNDFGTANLPAGTSRVVVAILFAKASSPVEAGTWVEAWDVRLVDVTGIVALGSQITTVSNAQVAGDATLAQQITTLRSTVDNNTALVTQEATTRATETGGLFAQYTVKVATVRYDGKPVVAGIGLASQAGLPSEMILQADKLFIIPGTDLNGTAKPFLAAGYVNGVQTVVIPNAMLGDATVDGRLVVGGSIDTPKLNVGFGGRNLLTNPMPSTNTLAPWTPGYNTTGQTPAGGLNVSFAPWFPTGSNGLYAVFLGSPFGVLDISNSNFDGVGYPVTVGQRYEFSVYMSTHRCAADCAIVFEDANGAYINETHGSSFSNIQAGNQLSNWPRSFGFAVAPAGAARARFIVRVYYNGQTQPYCFISMAYLGECGINQTVPSPWTAGGVGTQINGGSIYTQTIDATKIRVNSLSALSATIGTLRTAASGGRLEISDNILRVFDDNGNLRVKLGNLSL